MKCIGTIMLYLSNEIEVIIGYYSIKFFFSQPRTLLTDTRLIFSGVFFFIDYFNFTIQQPSSFLYTLNLLLQDFHMSERGVEKWFVQLH